MSEKFHERQTAVKLKIEEINKSEFIAEEGWAPNYLLTKKGDKVSRVNLMGVILDKDKGGVITNLVLDDGSGRIVIRSFENIKNLESVEIGDCILMIGRIRSFNREKYISPEIIKKIGKDWLKIRRLELERKEDKKTTEEEKEDIGIESKKTEEKSGKEEAADSADKKIIGLVKEMDKGDGALIEEVVERAETKQAEEIIEKMLKNGEIFQNHPGRIKVL